ncbi:hypothetical protein SD78_0383 [Bacillus badius]|nr:hypothetical protein SD78_0383 [Bacillus badius]
MFDEDLSCSACGFFGCSFQSSYFIIARPELLIETAAG